MVDSSVGGKTALDHPKAKNAIGAFHQPRAVLIDTDTLGSLPERELRAGLAEVIKYGVIVDRAFFEWLEARLPDLLARRPAELVYAIERSCALKAAIVGRDEREEEGGARALLNFGHTFAHAIETCSGYQGYLDKKARHGKVRFVLATGLGSARVFDDVSDAAAKQVWASARA
jgi:3-dehydroquinate synthase